MVQQGAHQCFELAAGKIQILEGIQYIVQHILHAPQYAQCVAEVFQAVVHVVVAVLQILQRVFDVADVQPVGTGHIVDVVHEVFQIGKIVFEVFQHLLIVRDVLFGIGQRRDHAICAVVNGVQVFFGGIQFRDERFGIARKRFECVQRLVHVRVNGAARSDQLLAHLVDARDAVRHGLDAALHAAHGVQHVGEALVKVVVRAFKLVTDAAEI